MKTLLRKWAFRVLRHCWVDPEANPPVPQMDVQVAYIDRDEGLVCVDQAFLSRDGRWLLTSANECEVRGAVVGWLPMLQGPEVDPLLRTLGRGM